LVLRELNRSSYKGGINMLIRKIITVKYPEFHWSTVGKVKIQKAWKKAWFMEVVDETTVSILPVAMMEP